MAHKKDTTDLTGIRLECMGSADPMLHIFVTERKRSEAALIQVIQEAYIQGVSTRKIEKLAKKLGKAVCLFTQADMAGSK